MRAAFAIFVLHDMSDATERRRAVTKTNKREAKRSSWRGWRGLQRRTWRRYELVFYI